MKSEFYHSPISIQFTLMSEEGYSSIIIFLARSFAAIKISCPQSCQVSGPLHLLYSLCVFRYFRRQTLRGPQFPQMAIRLNTRYSNCTINSQQLFFKIAVCLQESKYENEVHIRN